MSNSTIRSFYIENDYPHENNHYQLELSAYRLYFISQTPIAQYLRTLSKDKANELLYHFSFIGIYTKNYEIYYKNNGENNINDVINKNKYLIDGFRLVCPSIIVFVDLINGTDIVIKLEWNEGSMDNVVYDKYLGFVLDNYNNDSNYNNICKNIENMNINK